MNIDKNISKGFDVIQVSSHFSFHIRVLFFLSFVMFVCSKYPKAPLTGPLFKFRICPGACVVCGNGLRQL